ncbi:hypothetical protein MWU76_11105 [Gelidibacter sp. F2691]|nr:hypothetical protein [Gelidibacter sp. F2691]
MENNLTNPCAKSIFSELEIEMIKKNLLQKFMYPNSKVHLTLSESILKLFNDSDSVKLSITDGKLIDANGRTTGTAITISESYLKSATSLSIARTMIHEMTHAYINALFFDHKEFESLDFRQKLAEYARSNGYGADMPRTQHEFMGEYVDAMAVSLLSWDLKYGTGGIKTEMEVLDWNYYRSIAFGGFVYAKKDFEGNYILDNNGNKIYEDTDSFKKLVPDLAERDKIKEILKNEQIQNGNAKGEKC